MQDAQRMTNKQKTILIYVGIGLVAFAYAAWYRSNSIYQHFDAGVPDDASYYLKPALNFVTGHGSSFDGINPTNGYQPLWFGTLVTFLKFLPLHQMSLSDIWYAALLLQAATLGAFTACFTYFLYRFTQSPALAALLGFLPLLVLSGRILNLLETPLQLLMISIVLIQLFNLFERPAYEDFRERLLLLGISVGLLFLARTDGIFMVPALLLPFWIKFRRDLKRLTWFVAPVVVIVVGYMALNYFNFGVLMPISGEVKLDSLHITLASHPGWSFVLEKLKFIFGPYEIGNPPIKILIQLFAFLTPLLLVIRQVRGRILSNRQLILLGLGAFLLCKYLAYTTIYHNWRANSYWYWVVDVIVWLVIAAAISRQYLAKWKGSDYFEFGRRAVPVIMGLLLIISVVRGAQVRAKEPAKPARDTSVLLDLASFLAEHDYFANKKLGAYNAGILGYFGGRQLTNLDGLINSPEFARLIRIGQRDAYIQKNIDILVEYHGAYVNYYTGLGYSLYNVRDYIRNPVPFNPQTGDDYRIYVKHGQEKSFEELLSSLSIIK
jgi:hypothetical protein